MIMKLASDGSCKRQPWCCAYKWYMVGWSQLAIESVLPKGGLMGVTRLLWNHKCSMDKGTAKGRRESVSKQSLPHFHFMFSS